jgi:molecular chaperone IbpA
MTKEYFQDPFAFTKNLLPSSVGFDHMFKNLESAQKAIHKMAANYPPYNIKKTAENTYVIEIAVAGFGKQDIELELNEGMLTIKGQTSLDTLTKDGTDITYLHKGIADRAFTRQFSLADTIEIKNAEMFNGMLKVWLENIIPESKKPRKIDITDSVEKSYGEKVHSNQFLAETKS